MKKSLGFLVLAAAIGLPQTGAAANLNFNFLNDVHSSAGVSVGASHTFTDTNNDPYTITASVDPSTKGYSLFEKNGGGSENGLGVTPGSDNEINPNLPGVMLNFNNLLSFHPGSISITLGSVQNGENGIVTYIDGDHDGDTYSFNITDQNSHLLDLSRLYEDGGSILVTAGSGNVLISDVTATAPEPASVGIAGLGLLGLGALMRRKTSTKKA